MARGIERELVLKARTSGPLVFVTSYYAGRWSRYREYDTDTLARVWKRLGPEKFRARYQFDWEPPAEVLEEIAAETGGARK